MLKGVVEFRAEVTVNGWSAANAGVMTTAIRSAMLKPLQKSLLVLLMSILLQRGAFAASLHPGLQTV
jgi:hypothetical protein